MSEIKNHSSASAVTLPVLETSSDPLPASEPNSSHKFENHDDNKPIAIKHGNSKPSSKTDLPTLLACLDYNAPMLFISAIHELSRRLDELQETEVLIAIQAAEKFLLRQYSSQTRKPQMLLRIWTNQNRFFLEKDTALPPKKMELFQNALQTLFMKTSGFTFGHTIRDRFLFRSIDDLNTGNLQKVQMRLIWLSTVLGFYSPEQKRDILGALENALPLCTGEWVELCKNLLIDCLQSLDKKQQDQYTSIVIDRLEKPNSIKLSDFIATHFLLDQMQNDVLSWESLLRKAIKVITSFQEQAPTEAKFSPMFRLAAGHLLIEVLTIIPNNPDLKRNRELKHSHSTLCSNQDRCYDDLVCYQLITETLFQILRSDDLKYSMPWQNAFVNFDETEQQTLLKILQEGEHNFDPEIRYFYYITQINCLFTQTAEEFPIAPKLQEIRDRMLRDDEIQIRKQAGQIFKELERK